MTAPAKVNREIVQTVFMTPDEQKIAQAIADQDGRNVPQQIRWMLWQEAIKRGIVADPCQATVERDEQDDAA